MMFRIITLVLVLLSAAPSVQAAEEVRVIDSRPGVTEAILLIHPATAPVASVVLFTGGGGAIGIKPGWPVGKRGGNFLVRTADLFAQAGFLVAIIDTPSDSASALWNLRGTARHAQDVAAAIAMLRRDAMVPVWLIGTSMGSLSAANAAARLREEGPDGVVLTSSVTVTSRNSTESVLTLDLEEIRVPLLVVNHRDDACKYAPPGDAERILREARNTPRREAMVFGGGKPNESSDCEPFAPHGYFGIEQEVVTGIVRWILAP
ncbi:MAG: alpha/beta hydrolase [Magnetospirillum sp.]|nr:MAG: alpha/beta hydrolase [Magnetospirillum sp.]